MHMRFFCVRCVQVILDRILAQERKLQFSIVEEDLPLSGKKPGKSGPRPKKGKRKDAAAPESKAKKKAHASPARSFNARKKPGKMGKRRSGLPLRRSR